MTITQYHPYLEMLESFVEENSVINELCGKTVLLTGASGMIGSFLVDVIMYANSKRGAEDKTRVIAVARNAETARKRFAAWESNDELSFVSHDVCCPLPELGVEPDYYIHAASTTHPRAYVDEPVNTILANVLGTKQLLDFISARGKGKFLLLSSVEIYGENRGDTDYFSEDYCGYINCNTLRAGYQEAKRVSESLCQAYIRQSNVDASIVRLSRTYGPTMRMNDSKAAAQFILRGVRQENIVLKSDGHQLFSYSHTYDVASGILYVLLRGKTGEAYNLGSPDSDITLRELAETIANHVGTEVVFAQPEGDEKAGYSTATKALMDAHKLKSLGWTPKYNIRTGICETVDFLREIQ